MTTISKAVPLYGLVLAGGRGSRLGRDKGSLDFHGLPQVRRTLELLAAVCDRSFVSLRPDQAGAAAYRGLAIIEDLAADGGPAGGLMAAVRAFPGVAWLVVAADLPLLTAATLAALVSQRDSALLATAFRHPDGTPEPVCTIFEPAMAALLGAAVEPRAVSLRRLLEQGPARIVDCPDADALTSVNTPADEQRIRRLLAARGERDM
jgi:molybdenum cofactor guanylyltransferase